MADQKVRYQVEVTKTGEGGKQAAAELNSVAAAAKQVAAAQQASKAQLANVEAATKSATNAMRAMHGTLTMIGFQAFPQLTLAATAASSAFNGLKAASTSMNMSLAATAGGASVVLTGVVAAMATWNEGIKSVRAELNAMKSEAVLKEQFEMLRDKLIPQLDRAMKLGRMDRATGVGLKNRLTNARNWDGSQHESLRAAQTALQGINAEDAQALAREKYEEFFKGINVGLLEEGAKAKAQLSASIEKTLSEGTQLAVKAGLDMGPMTAWANAMSKKGFGEIDAAAAAKHMADMERESAQTRAQLAQMAAEKIQALEQNLTLTALQSGANRKAVAEDEFRARVVLYEELVAQGALSEGELTKLTNQAKIERLRALSETRAAHTEEVKSFNRLAQIREQSLEAFSGGLASTLVNVRAWTDDAGAAFGQFFAGLAQQVAQAILQFQIMQLVMGIGKAFSGGAGAGVKGAYDVNPSAFAGFAKNGGMFPRFAANGLAGVGEVSAPTFFPRFNVVAGEAGREMLTVLSRPRMMEVGGVQAAVGNAAGNRLAITSADQLAQRGGAGGAIDIRVSMEPGLKAEIINNSVQGAVVRVTQDVGRHTRLREAVKSASS